MARIEDGVLKTRTRLKIASWSPGKEGEELPPTEVHIIMAMPELEAAFVCRIKSRQEAEEIIAGLIEHSDRVWPRPKH